MELTEDRGPEPRRRSRLALWGILAVVALVAGVGIVVAADGDDATAGPPLPITLSGPAGGEEGQSLAAPESDAASTADMTMAVWAHYVAGDGLPALGGTGTAYRIVGDVDEARVAALAAAVGLEGTPEQISEVDGWRVEDPGVGLLEAYPWGGGTWWFNLTSATDGGGVVSSDGSSAGVAVAEERTAAEEEPGGGGGSPRDAGFDPCADGEECELPPDVVQCMEEFEATGSGGPCAGAPDGGTYCIDSGTEERCWPCDAVENCGDGAPMPEPADDVEPVPEPLPSEPPAPAADLPSQVDAEQIARDLYAAAGGTFEVIDVVADGPYEAWYITLKLGVGGQAVMGLEWNVGVGPEGVIQSAGGSLGRLEELGTYDLLDTTAAIERLNEQMGGFAEVQPLPAEDVPVVAEEPPTTSVEPTCGTTPDGGQYCEGFEGTGEPVEDPPSDCKPQPDGREICEFEDPGAGGAPSDGTVPTCKPQPDGREICETEPGAGSAPSDGSAPTCKPQPDGSEICEFEDPADGDVLACDTPTTIPTDDPEAPVSSDCDDYVVVDPIPEPVPTEPQEIVLTGAEPILLAMPSWDGVDTFVVPVYRFTGDDGIEVVVHAVVDEAIEPIQPPSTDTIVSETTLPPETVEPQSAPEPSGPAEPIVEGTTAPTTHPPAKPGVETSRTEVGKA